MIDPAGMTSVNAAPATIVDCWEMIAAPVLSAEIVPSLLVVWRVFSLNGTVNVLDMVFPYLSGYPRLSLSRLTRKCWWSAEDVSSYNYLCK